MPRIRAVLAVSSLTLAGLTVALPQAAQAATNFSAGNLVLYRVGDGSAALASSATATFLDEYSPSGNAIQSLGLPTTLSGTNKRLTASGSASSEGLLNLSSDGRYLLATGYNAALGTASVASTASSVVSRTVGLVDASGTVDTTTSLTDAFSGNNIRSTASQDGTTLELAGAVSTTGAMRSATRGATTSTPIVSSPSSLRASGIYGGQLYVSASTYVAKVGSGVPTTGTNTVSPLTFDTAPGNAYGFTFLSLGAVNGPPDTLYVADGTAGIVKYALQPSGTWAKKGTVAVSGITGITANDVNGVAQIYASGPTGVYAVTDPSGQAGTLSGGAAKIVSAATNTAIRGIAFAPGTTIGSGPGNPPSVPTISATYAGLPAALGDPTNATDQITVADDQYAANQLTVSASSSNQQVAADSALSVTGTGSTRTLTVGPAGAVGTATITLTVTAPDGQSATTTVAYGVSADQGGSSDRYYLGAGNASAAIDVGGGYMVVGDDESNVLRLYDATRSGPPAATFDFTSRLPFGTAEVDIEGAARVGNLIYWTGSMSNNSSGNVAPARSTVFATRVSGSGASTTLSYVGSYTGLQSAMVSWDDANGHGLGARSLGLDASVNGGTANHTTSSFNVEGLEFAAGSPSTAYFAFRGTLQPTSDRHLALVVPVTNLDALVTGTTSTPTFGAPIFWDLGGLGIRDIRRNANGDYLILAGTAQDTNATWRLYTWDGDPNDPPLPGQSLPLVPAAPAQGSWEAIVATPDPLVDGSAVEVIEDNGTTAWYGDGQTQKNGLLTDLQKDLGRTFSYVRPNMVATTTTLSASPSTSTAGQTVQYTATVTPASGSSTPPGSVTFAEGAQTITGCAARPVRADGTATCSVTYPHAGSHTVTAAYSGSAAYAASTSDPLTVSVDQAATSTTLSVSSNDVTAGDQLTYTATVTGAGDLTAGTVSFTDAGSGIDGCSAQPVSSDGTATCAVTYAHAGSHRVRAAYSGTADLTASTSDPVSVSVDQAATTTTLSVSSNDVTVGDQVTYTATVSGPADLTAGTVSFTDSGSDSGSAIDGCSAQPVSADGEATCTVTYAHAGSHRVRTAYSGTPDLSGSTSDPVSVSVGAATTTTSLTSDNQQLVTGQSVTFTATVSPSAATGTVEFRVDGTDLPGCDAVLVSSSGQAQCSVANGFAPSTPTVVAIYSGDPDYAGSQSSGLVETVTKADTTVTVSSNPDPPTAGAPATFTAIVAPVAPGAGTPTGTATFTVTSRGSSVHCTGGDVVTLSDGAAACRIPGDQVSAGSALSVEVSYSGDAGFAASTGSLDRSANRAGSTTTLTSSADPATGGAKVTLRATVAPAGPAGGEPTGTVTFTVTGQDDSQVTCTRANTVTLKNRVATCVLPPGSHPATNGPYLVEADYSGNDQLLPSTGRFTQHVSRDAAKLSLSQSTARSPAGDPVTFTATLTAPPHSTTAPTGAITIVVTDRSGAAVTCTPGPAQPQREQCTVASGTLTRDSSPYTATASYAGDRSYLPASSAVKHKVAR